MKKQIKYEKEYTSRKNKEVLEEIRAEEDNLFMQEFEEKFENAQKFGFDGTLSYFYEINSTINIPNHLDKILPYKVIFTINKFGNPRKFHYSTDLEYFLLDKGFKKIED